jgi:hypothetical protein
MRKSTHKLTVHSAPEKDVYRDVLRIPASSRGALRTGRIHSFQANGHTIYGMLRGTTADAGSILMDSALRDRLHLTSKTEYDFHIREAGFWGQVRWGWNATDPALMIASRLGVVSLFAALVSLLGLVPLFVDLYEAVRKSVCG